MEQDCHKSSTDNNEPVDCSMYPGKIKQSSLSWMSVIPWQSAGKVRTYRYKLNKSDDGDDIVVSRVYYMSTLCRQDGLDAQLKKIEENNVDPNLLRLNMIGEYEDSGYNQI